MAEKTEHNGPSRGMIELHFLSGDWRGKRHYADGDAISVGDDESCELRLPPDTHATAARRDVLIRYATTGWVVRNRGTSTVMVNHEVVTSETRIKSGDVIRMSLTGPEVVFSITSSQSVPAEPMPTVGATKAADPARHHRSMSRLYPYATAATVVLLLVCWVLFRPSPLPAVSVRSIPEQSVDENQQWALSLSDYVTPSAPGAYRFQNVGTLPDGLELDEDTGQLRWTPSEAQGPDSYECAIVVRSTEKRAAGVARVSISVRETNTPPRIQAIPDLTFALGTKEALEVAVIATDDDLPRQPTEFRLAANAPPGMSIDPVAGLVRWTPKLEHAGQVFPVEVLVNDPQTAQSPQRLSFRITVLAPETEAPAEAEVAAALFLLCVEEPATGTVFPFAVSCAVRDDVLLTSGSVVQELVNARRRGMAVLAIHCLSRKQEQTRGMYLHPDFTRLQEEPGQQIYCDLGLVRLPPGVRSVAPLAADADALSLERGYPLRCVMPIFEAEPLTRFDDITPAAHSAEIDMITRLPDATASPEAVSRLFHVIGALPRNAFGSPVVNEQGQVVAIYVEKADLSHEASLARLAEKYHYLLGLDSLAERLDDKLSSWQLALPDPSEATSGENQ